MLIVAAAARWSSAAFVWADQRPLLGGSPRPARRRRGSAITAICLAGLVEKHRVHEHALLLGPTWPGHDAVRRPARLGRPGHDHLAPPRQPAAEAAAQQRPADDAVRDLHDPCGEPGRAVATRPRCPVATRRTRPAHQAMGAALYGRPEMPREAASRWVLGVRRAEASARRARVRAGRRRAAAARSGGSRRCPSGRRAERAPGRRDLSHTTRTSPGLAIRLLPSNNGAQSIRGARREHRRHRQDRRSVRPRTARPTQVTERQAREVAEAARETEWTRPSFAKELYLGRFDLVADPPAPACRRRMTSARRGVPRPARAPTARRSTAAGSSASR